MARRALDTRADTTANRCSPTIASLPDSAMALLGWLMQPGQPPPPSLEDLLKRPEWMDRAACRGQGTDDFFPSRRGNAGAAKAICAGCEVRGECLDYTLAIPPQTECGAERGPVSE